MEYYKLQQTLPELFHHVSTKKSSIPLRILDSLYSFSEGKAWAARTGTITTPLWKTVGISCKLLGLAGFWAGDNVLYLASSGFLPKADKEKAQFFSMRSYFFGALVGLYVSWKEIQAHQPVLLGAIDRVNELMEEEEYFSSEDSGEEDDENDGQRHETNPQLNEALDALSEARSRQFVLFLSLLKASTLMCIRVVSGLWMSFYSHHCASNILLITCFILLCAFLSY